MPGRTRFLLRDVQPDAVHIVTEGPLGILGQYEAIRRGWPFTTSFHTRWDQYGKHLLALPPAVGWPLACGDSMGAPHGILAPTTIND